MPVYSRVRWGVLAVVVTLQLGVAKCASKPGVSSRARNTKVAPDPQADSADQVLYGVRAVLTDHGVTKAMLVADRGYVFEDGTRMEARGVTVTMIDSAGVKGAVMTAQRSTYHLLRARFESRGQVVVRGVDGRQLHTERLVFDLARNLLVGDSAYVLSDSIPKRKTTGVAFELDPKLRKPAKLAKRMPTTQQSAPTKIAPVVSATPLPKPKSDSTTR